MKIRNDFVTNSSSANYILEVALITDEGNGAGLNLAVSPETCWCEDGDMTADDIYLIPEYTDGKPSIGQHRVSSATSVDELITWIADEASIVSFFPRNNSDYDDLDGKTVYIDPDTEFAFYEPDRLEECITENGATLTDDLGEADIILSDKRKSDFGINIKESAVLNETEFACAYDEDAFDEMQDWGASVFPTVSVSEVCPKSIAAFREECKKAGITAENLKSIDINNAKYGSGDSAMWVEKDILREYKDRYLSAETDEEKTSITEEAVNFMLSKPVVEVNDNSCYLDDAMQIVLANNNADVIREEILKYFRGEGNSYWMGMASVIYRIDVKNETMVKEELLKLYAD